MNKTIITKKQRETLDFIKNFISQNREAPTITELKKEFGLRSLRSVTQRLESLEKKGFIKRDRFQHRSIRILESDLLSPFGTIQIPVIASAGCDAAQIYAEQQYDEYLAIDNKMIDSQKNIVAIKAIGNSMIDAGIRNGDYVLVEVTENVQSGDRVIALFGEMAVIKRLKQTDTVTILEPESKGNGYPTIIMSEGSSKIFGKVLSVIPITKSNEDYQYIYDSDIKHN